MSDPLPAAQAGPLSAAKAVRPRHAASLLLVRRAARGPEVLMGRRPARSAFAPSVFVFPGGGVERRDYAVRPSRGLSDDCARRTGAPPRLAQALAVAALRETFEETGLSVGDPAAPDLSALRLQARAITPPRLPRRFHARFFLAEADEARGALADSAELADLAFFDVSDALAKLPLMDVTEEVLRSLLLQNPSPFLFSYRGGRSRKSELA